ncbi:MAG: glycosyltransferase family 1 protein [Actinobacteria bacterium]|nr:MAG: glycosyltransferase family 1 protein [Actinomycetota bacterium]
MAPPRDPYGRLVANAGLFRALAQDGGYQSLHVLSHPGSADTQSLRAELGLVDAEPPEVTVGPLFGTAAATAAGALLYGQPYLTEPAWARRHGGGDDAYSIVGSIFAFASAPHREQMLMSLLAPVWPWDALVCSSTSLRTTVQAAIDEWEDVLRGRLGAADAQRYRLPRPQLPVIPFGTAVGAVASAASDAEARHTMRADLGIPDQAVMIYHLARLSPYDKAFPQPMLRAVQRAQQQCGARLHLVLAGWFPDGEQGRRRYDEAIAAYCPDVPVTILDGNDPDVIRRCWAAADVFLLLSDTILETFGQALIEAMAAGLPLVVSDWDGYRDIVRDGLDGYLIPTLGAPPGPLGRSLALMELLGDVNYAQYGGATAAHTAVDVDAAAQALARLADDPEHRRRLGGAGAERARQEFDWRVVAGQYQLLFADLAERRQALAPTIAELASRRLSPLRDDPFRTFAALPSSVLGDDTLLRPGRVDADAWSPRVELDEVHPGLRGDADEARAVLAYIAERGQCRLADVTALFPPRRRPFVRMTIMWLAKSAALSWTAE